MLIKVKPTYSSEQRRWRKQDSDSQYRVQRGIAKAALEAKAEGKVPTDAGGRPLYYATGAMQGFGFKELEQKLKGRPGVRTVFGDARATGSRRTPWPWEKHA